MAAVNAQPDVERTRAARAARRGGATPTSRAAGAACSGRRGRRARRAPRARGQRAASLDTRKMVEAMRETARKLIPQLAQFAVDETGFGRVEDKLKKNRCRRQDAGPGDPAADRVHRRRRPDADRARAATASSARSRRPPTRPRPSSATPSAWSPAATRSCSTSTRSGANVGDPGAHLQRGDRRGRRARERARLRRAADHRERPGADEAPGRPPAGGHRRPGVVKAAMAQGKKAIAAGPGNPPAVVDETADLDTRRPTSCGARRSTTTSSAPRRRRSSRSRRSPTR